MTEHPSIEKLYELYASASGACTDTRRITPGCMFFALKGEHFDGNDFAWEAFRQGAAKVVLDDRKKAGRCEKQLREARRNAAGEEVPPAGALHARRDIILVPDVLEALQQLAACHRKRFHIPVLALTGTNGKTTTKELIAAVLSRRFRVVATEGNLNNHIGVPLTLLRIDEKTEAAVVEMGASAPGEIRTLAEIAHPTFGLITNVGKAHLQGFGSLEGVKKTKGELYDYLEEHKKIAFVNTDNPHLTEMAALRSGMTLVPYGLNNDGARVLPSDETDPYLKLVVPNPCLLSVCENMDRGLCECLARERGVTRENCEPKYMEIHTRLIGKYNADNVMAALCVGSYFDVQAAEAVSAIEAYTPSNNRSQMARTGRNTLIIDAYNANPTSMRAALENFADLQSRGKCLILGDMLELGADSAAEHARALELALSLVPERIFLVGGEFGRAWAAREAQKNACGGTEAAQVRCFPDSAALREFLSGAGLQGKTILIKGSRGIRLERVLEAL